jgi:hypothetical protein
MNYKWAQQDSNLRPTSYEPAALTAELWALAQAIIAYLIATVKRVKPLIWTGNEVPQIFSNLLLLVHASNKYDIIGGS